MVRVSLLFRYMIKNTLESKGLYSATINIPLNVTGVQLGQKLKQPPWTLW